MNKGDRYTDYGLKTDIEWIKLTLGNHLRHHERYEIALVTGILLAVFGQVICDVLK